MARLAHLLCLVSFGALVPCCCPTAPAPHKPEKAMQDPAMHVVMVHGILERGKNFKMLRERLEKQGVACHVVELKPSDARTGIEVLARSLAEQIASELGSEQSFSMIGFSMGGLVSRYYLQNLGGARRCDQLITLASPHHGTWTAYLYPGKGARQMRPNSPFLRQLAASEDQLGEMPVTSYRTALDLVILPTTSSIWERAENRLHFAPLHPLMLNLPTVLGDIEKRLLNDR